MRMVIPEMKRRSGSAPVDAVLPIAIVVIRIRRPMRDESRTMGHG